MCQSRMRLLEICCGTSHLFGNFMIKVSWSSLVWNMFLAVCEKYLGIEKMESFDQRTWSSFAAPEIFEKLSTNQFFVRKSWTIAACEVFAQRKHLGFSPSCPRVHIPVRPRFFFSFWLVSGQYRDGDRTHFVLSNGFHNFSAVTSDTKKSSRSSWKSWFKVPKLSTFLKMPNLETEFELMTLRKT